jgi:ribosomal protein L15
MTDITRFDMENQGLKRAEIEALNKIAKQLEELNLNISKPKEERSNESELFSKYEKVRSSGKYNMTMESDKAMKEAGLTKDEYFFVINNYARLSILYF